jgi:hypothetical protein
VAEAGAGAGIFGADGQVLLVRESYERVVRPIEWLPRRHEALPPAVEAHGRE